MDGAIKGQMDVMSLNVSLDLTKTELEALAFEAEAENLTIEGLIEWIVRQNIPSLLDVVGTRNERRRQDLARALQDEIPVN